MEVVAEAEDGVAALESTQSHRPDVAVLDVSMPRMTGLQAAREIRSHVPDTRVLLLSMHDDERYFLEGLEAGAAGYVLKRAADTDLIGAVRTVAAGRTFLSDDAQRTLMDEWLETGSPEPEDPLTPRELEVVKLIAEAFTNRQIAETLKLSEKTVESHRANVLSKLQCATAWSWCATRSGAASWSRRAARSFGAPRSGGGLVPGATLVRLTARPSTRGADIRPLACA